MNHAGQMVLKVKAPYRDGTSHIVMSPLEFMQRLAARVPRPRLHLIRFHGVLAPDISFRRATNERQLKRNATVSNGSEARVHQRQLLGRLDRTVGLRHVAPASSGRSIDPMI